ncbi:DUF7604 domain-containing protein [Robinsoniella peoriensis]
MKNKVKQRLLAVVLCLVLLLSNNISLMARENKIADIDSSAAGAESSEQGYGTGDLPLTVQDQGSEGSSQSNHGNGMDNQIIIPETESVNGQQSEMAEPQTGAEPQPEPQMVPQTEPQTEDKSEAAPETNVNETETEPVNNSGQEDSVIDTEADAPFSGTYQDESVEVRVSAEAGVIPKDAQLAVTPILRKEIPSEATQEEKEQIENINAKFSQTQMKLEEAVSEKEDTSLAGFVAYDISFIITDAITGEKSSEIEPAGEVKVHMNFLNGASVENEKEDANTQVRVQHLEENETAPNGVQVVDITDQADITVEEDGIVKDVAFSSDKFSVYALAFEIRSVESYARSQAVKIECRDMSSGAMISGSPNSITIDNGEELSLSAIADRVGKISGYGSLMEAVCNRYNITGLRVRSNVQQFQYNNYYWYDVNNATVYLYFDKVTNITVRCFDYYTGKEISGGQRKLSIGKNQKLDSLEKLYSALEAVEGYDRLLYAKQGNNTLYGMSMDRYGNLSYKNSFAQDSWTGTNTYVSFDFYLQPVRDSGSTDEYGEVHHKKQIDYLGDKGVNQDTNLRGEDKYRLYLDVTGTPETAPEPADIVLVLDSSGSMAWNMNNGSNASLGSRRMDYLKTATRNIIDTLKSSQSNNRIAIVEFDTEINTWANLNENLSAGSLKDIIGDAGIADGRNGSGKLRVGGGTDYSLALAKANEMLYGSESSGSEKRKKFVVFVTDGAPTAPFGGGSTTTERDKQAGLNAAAALPDLSGFYVVGVAGNTMSDNIDYLKTLTETPKSVLKDYLAGNDAEGLKDAFKSITSTITKQIAGVSIQDTLSKHVKFAPSATLDLKVTKLAPDAGAVPEVMNKNDYTVTTSGKTIKVDFGKDYFLDPRAVYTVSFNIVLEEESKDLEPVDMGQDNTDYDKWYPFSEGKKGLYSNEGDVSQTNVSFYWVDNGVWTPKKLPYNIPIVKPLRQEGKVRIQKIIDGVENEVRQKLSKDQFMIEINSISGDSFQTAAILTDNQISSYITVYHETVFQISEIMPQEYTYGDPALVIKSADGKDVGSNRIDLKKGTVTIKPGDDVIVEVHNQYTPQNYFHNYDTKSNDFASYSN